jgi:hypothetical protein
MVACNNSFVLMECWFVSPMLVPSSCVGLQYMYDSAGDLTVLRSPSLWHVMACVVAHSLSLQTRMV